MRAEVCAAILEGRPGDAHKMVAPRRDQKADSLFVAVHLQRMR